MPEKMSAPSTQAQLLAKRDAKLREQFDYYYKTKRMRLDDVLVQLEEEFFITYRTIRGILKGGDSLSSAAPASLGRTRRNNSPRNTQMRVRFAERYLGQAAGLPHYKAVISELVTEFNVSRDIVRSIVGPFNSRTK